MTGEQLQQADAQSRQLGPYTLDDLTECRQENDSLHLRIKAIGGLVSSLRRQLDTYVDDFADLRRQLETAQADRAEVRRQLAMMTDVLEKTNPDRPDDYWPGENALEG